MNNKELNEFINSDVMMPPDHITKKLKGTVHQDLSPSLFSILTKVFLIQAIMGYSTLLICSQFGIEVFEIKGLSEIFQKLGNVACMSLCGALFLGVGSTATMLILRPEEIRILWRVKNFTYIGFSILFLFIFSQFGSEHLHLSMFASWFAGSLIASYFMLKFVKDLRFPNWNSLTTNNGV